jgi:hypothetical protein
MWTSGTCRSYSRVNCAYITRDNCHGPSWWNVVNPLCKPCTGVIEWTPGHFWRTVSRDLDSEFTRELFLRVPGVNIYHSVCKNSLFRCSWPPNGHPRKASHLQGWFAGSQDIVGGQYLEFHTYNPHGNCFYVYLMSISTLVDVTNPYSDYLDLQTDICAKWVTYAIFGFLGP